VLAALAGALGEPWEVGSPRTGEHQLGTLFHAGIGLPFIVVPGGWLRMGFSVDDVYALAAAREDESRLPWRGIGSSRPSRWVRISPFLLAIDALPPEGGEAYHARARAAYHDAVSEVLGDEPIEHGELDDDPPVMTVEADSVDEYVPEGFRLPREAEMEWVFREGGKVRFTGVREPRLTAENRRGQLRNLRNGFGLRGFADLQNITSDVWSDEHPSRVARSAHTYWQDEDAEMIGIHAAYRYVPDEYGDSVVRLAFDLPGASDLDLGAAGELADHDACLKALRDGDPRAREDAFAALKLVRGDREDLGATIQAVLGLAADGVVPTELLTWLGDLEYDGPSDALLPLLRHVDPSVRGAAVYALQRCTSAIAAMKERLTSETAGGVRVGLALSLAVHGESVDAGGDPLLAAAVAVGNAERGVLDCEALIGAISVPTLEHLAFAQGRLAEAALARLGGADDATRQRIAVIVARRAVELGDRGLAHTAAEFAFGAPERHPDPRAPQEATEAQREVAEVLIGANAIDLEPFGFPSGRVACLRWVGIVPPGVLEQEIVFEGRRLPLWCAMRAAEDAGEIVATLGAVDRLLIEIEDDSYGVRSSGDLEALRAEAQQEDLEGARKAVRATLSAYVEHGQSGYAHLVSTALALSPDEAPDPAWLRAVNDHNLEYLKKDLSRFPPEAILARVLPSLREDVREALASDGWSIGSASHAEGFAPLLSHAPSAELARLLLVLGWAGGQPASVRKKVGKHGKRDEAVQAVLAEYDTIPGDIQRWLAAREALLALWGGALG